MRVTRPAVEYLSMLANEKRWMLRYMPSRRFAAKPVEAWDAVCAQTVPKTSDSIASAIIRKP